ncbi:MerR family transcriptional regulator [Paenibacillus alvei]|uniref:MerR family transcriptional regulator n=1 Tax=Paenibacillus alvei TaxID=44250 RepID=UPI0018CDF682|nr:MerR family transcriptional regulator [Paenibacillus alvei]MBG9737518.1 MerR family transcriptional regulator [Paenibacillus alvei]MBG9747209.1 MerR family transcriptional regulator [Paenibacillus alvei]MCY9581315.1 MerR family transcriptional regulator [Paenibacillus alvei]MCY9584395.1 MerR family transcriptional regulator [Paenibacillus alvei]
MYTIGQVAKYLGVSRDTLKFYEEKELVKPEQNRENGYRTYNHFDIYDIATVNFYREIDFEIKKIQELRKGKSIEGIQSLLEEKERDVWEEIEYKKLLLKKLQLVKEDCGKIKQFLGKYIVKEMKPLEITGEIEHFTAYEEYEALKQNTENVKKAVTLTSLRRVIRFNEEGMIEDKFIIVRRVEEHERDIEGEILVHPKCLYTVIENGRWATGEESIDHQVEASLRKAAMEKEYELLGLVYINLLLTTYEDGLERVFLEIYAPIK